jgi:hypothetical protein
LQLDELLRRELTKKLNEKVLDISRSITHKHSGKVEVYLFMQSFNPMAPDEVWENGKFETAQKMVVFHSD